MNKKLNCSHCDKYFSNAAALYNHRANLKREKNVICKYLGCNKSFPSKSHLEAHKLSHKNTRPYLCTLSTCNFRAKSIYSLKQHAVSHGFGKSYSCEHCDYKATTPSNLKRHLRIHYGAKPYKCPHCFYRCVEFDALRKHVFNSSIHPGMPLYLCPYCKPRVDTIFESSSNLEEASSQDMVGFNTLSLARQHLEEAHLDRIKELAKSDQITMETFNERSVTRIFGLYDPTLDRVEPKEGEMIIQPRESSRTIRHKKKQLDKILSRMEEAKSSLEKPPQHKQVILVITPRNKQSPIIKKIQSDSNNISAPEYQKSRENETFHQIYKENKNSDFDFVQIGPAIWTIGKSKSSLVQ